MLEHWNVLVVSFFRRAALQSAENIASPPPVIETRLGLLSDLITYPRPVSKSYSF